MKVAKNYFKQTICSKFLILNEKKSERFGFLTKKIYLESPILAHRNKASKLGKASPYDRRGWPVFYTNLLAH